MVSRINVERLVFAPEFAWTDIMTKSIMHKLLKLVLSLVKV